MKRLFLLLMTLSFVFALVGFSPHIEEQTQIDSKIKKSFFKEQFQTIQVAKLQTQDFNLTGTETIQSELNQFENPIRAVLFSNNPAEIKEVIVFTSGGMPY